MIFIQGLSYIIDVYMMHANSAIAANTFFRSLAKFEQVQSKFVGLIIGGPGLYIWCVESRFTKCKFCSIYG